MNKKEICKKTLEDFKDKAIKKPRTIMGGKSLSRGTCTVTQDSTGMI